MLQGASPGDLARRCRGAEGSQCTAGFYRPPGKSIFQVSLIRSRAEYGKTAAAAGAASPVLSSATAAQAKTSKPEGRGQGAVVAKPVAAEEPTRADAAAGATLGAVSAEETQTPSRTFQIHEGETEASAATTEPRTLADIGKISSEAWPRRTLWGSSPVKLIGAASPFLACGILTPGLALSVPLTPTRSVGRGGLPLAA